MGYTVSANPQKLDEKWFIVDAENQVLGRLASDIASVLRGKNSPAFSPHVNMKHHVVVVNAEKIRLTGKKWADKKYYRHSGYRGGLSEETAEKLHARKPGEIIRLAVKGMLPKNRLAREIMTNIRIYAGPAHPHQAQLPQPMPARTATVEA